MCNIKTEVRIRIRTFRKTDPDPHQGEKPHPDPHQSEKQRAVDCVEAHTGARKLTNGSAEAHNGAKEAHNTGAEDLMASDAEPH